MDDAARPFALAIFTDTYDEVNGVTTIYRQFVAVANGDGGPPVQLAVFTLSDRTEVEAGTQATVFRYRPRPRLKLPRYPEVYTGRPPREEIAADFAAGRFDAVLVATPGPVGFLGKQLAQRARLPLIGFYHTRFPAYLAVYAHGLGSSRYVPTVAERVGYRWMHRLYGPCSLVLCQSATIASEIRRSSNAAIAVWDTGVDLRQFSTGPAPAFRERHGIPLEAIVVVYVGRLAAEKGLDALITLSHALGELTFLVVGDGPYAAPLQAAARATFCGFLRGRDLAESYRAGDIFFFPSSTDTFGNVLLEAMASGLPLVVVEGGPGAELVARSGAGLTYLPGDLDAAAAALRRLATDSAERATMARLARAHASDRDWPVAFGRFLALCQTAVAGTRRPRGERRHRWRLRPRLRRLRRLARDLPARGARLS